MLAFIKKETIRTQAGIIFANLATFRKTSKYLFLDLILIGTLRSIQRSYIFHEFSFLLAKRSQNSPFFKVMYMISETLRFAKIPIFCKYFRYNSNNKQLDTLHLQ